MDLAVMYLSLVKFWVGSSQITEVWPLCPFGRELLKSKAVKCQLMLGALTISGRTKPMSNY